MTAARRGEIWLVNLGSQVPQGHEQEGQRPAIVLQTNDLLALTTSVVIPLTTNLKRAFPSNVLIGAGEGGQQRDSLALCHQIRVLDHQRLTRKIGGLPPGRMSEIEAAIAFVLGLP